VLRFAEEVGFIGGKQIDGMLALALRVAALQGVPVVCKTVAAQEAQPGCQA
jgi:hypothetical protein